MIIDFHTHAFADDLAPRVISKLEAEGDCHAALDGRVDTLLASMDRAGIARSVVCPIATKPAQFEGIRNWAREVRSRQPRLEMFLSVHPDDPDALAHIDQTADEGFQGLKFHPYYQEFTLDDDRLFPLYERIAARGLIAVFHTGFDIAYPPDRICDPVRVRRVADTFPTLKLVATHLGAWRDWDNAREHLIGRPLYIETSYSIWDMPAEQARELILAHPPEYLLFGSDSPWADQTEELAHWRKLDLPGDLLAAALGGNAARLLART